jgi:hypothetical protein
MKHRASFLVHCFYGLAIFAPLTSAAQAVVTAGNIRLQSSAGTRLVVQGGISFTGTALFLDNGRVDVLSNPSGAASNWNDATAAGAYDGSSTGHVYFSAAAVQTINGTTRFYNLTMDGTEGITLGTASDIEVRNQLYLNGGYLSTGSSRVYVSNPALNAIQSSNAFNSFINGRLERFASIATTATPYTNGYLLPVGKIVGGTPYYAPVYYNKINSSSTRYTAEYFRAAPFDRNNIQSPPIDHVSFLEYWELTSTTPGGAADDDAILSLSWRNSSIVSTNPAVRDSLMIAHYRNNSGMRWEPEFNTALPNNINGTAAFGFVTSNVTVGSFTNTDRRFSLSTRTPNNVLPLRLFNWELLVKNQTAFIKWNVLDDRSIKEYTVERSDNGIRFTKLYTQKSGQSSSETNYRYNDLNPLQDWNYYRIRIDEVNGASYYSSVKKIKLQQDVTINIYPNPAFSELKVAFSNLSLTGASVQIIDANGRIVHHINSLQPVLQMDISRLKAGTYLLRYISGSAVITRSFVKIN